MQSIAFLFSFDSNSTEKNNAIEFYIRMKSADFVIWSLPSSFLTLWWSSFFAYLKTNIFKSNKETVFNFQSKWQIVIKPAYTHYISAKMLKKKKIKIRILLNPSNMLIVIALLDSPVKDDQALSF